MVRVTLKQILPIALLLTTSVIAQRDGSTTAVERASATEDQATETATDEATNTAEDTAEATETATGKDDDKSKDSTDTKDSSKGTKTGTKTGTKDSESATTTTEAETFSWNPTIPATSAPDLNAGSRSIQDGGYLALTLAVGMMTLGMALL